MLSRRTRLDEDVTTGTDLHLPDNRRRGVQTTVLEKVTWRLGKPERRPHRRGHRERPDHEQVTPGDPCREYGEKYEPKH